MSEAQYLSYQKTAKALTLSNGSIFVVRLIPQLSCCITPEGLAEQTDTGFVFLELEISTESVKTSMASLNVEHNSKKFTWQSMGQSW